MKKRILFLFTVLLAMIIPSAGNSQPPLPKPNAHPIGWYKHKQHKSKSKPHFFQLKK